MRKIFMNGFIHTFNDLRPLAEAVVTENGRFVDIGSTADMLLQWSNASSVTIDLEGKTVTPGLTDSHMHLSGIAKNFIHLDVTGLTSKQDMLAAIRHRASELHKGEWLIGRGWDENLFTDGSIPTIEELDQASPHIPLYIPRICGHAAIVNTKALEIAHYHPNITVPEGGTVVLDRQTNKPNGLLLETAADLITAHIPETSYMDMYDAMKKAVRYVQEKGITSIHTNDPVNLGGVDRTYHIYHGLINEEKMGLRCNLLMDHIFLDDLRERSMYAGYGNERLQIGAIKIFADGAMGRRTALLSTPYQDAPETYGDAMYDQATLYDIVSQARKMDMPVAVHAIGDKALENVLDILDRFPAAPYRDRLIHASIIRKDLLKRLAVPHRIVDIQPRFLASDFPWVIERIGEERLEYAYAWKKLLEAGVICAGGSDSPVEPIDPLLGIHAAVTRKKPDEHHQGYVPDQKLSMTEAFRLFTVMGAYPTNEEQIKGTIARGKLADMTVYSNHPFAMKEPDELLETNIDMTINGGEIVYQR